MTKKDTIERLSPGEVASMRAKREEMEEAQRVKAYWGNQAQMQKALDDAADRVARIEEARQKEEARQEAVAKREVAAARWDKAAKRIPEAAALLREQIRDEIRNKRDASKKKHEATLRALKKEQAQRLAQVAADEKAMLAMERALYTAAVPSGIPQTKGLSKADAYLVLRTQEDLARQAALTK